MPRYQLTISALCVLASAVGLFGIGRAALIGMDSIAYLSLGLMLFLVWLGITMIKRRPLAAEACVRLRAAPTWGELSPARRRFLRWFDWPLFVEIREQEAKRLLNEPLVYVKFDPDRVIIRPVETLHSEPYFLKAIAGAVAKYGSEISNVKQGVFGARLIGPQVNMVWRGSNRSIWQHLRAEISDRTALPLKEFIDALEAGYLNTLTQAERNAYYLALR